MSLPFTPRRCLHFSLVIFAVLLQGLRGFAQESNISFSKLSVQNGLSNNKVKCILQDKRGFIWIGTEDGLNRYDGQHFVQFLHDPSVQSGISGNIITDIIEDREGIIWIATEDGGLNRYDYRLSPQEQFRSYKHQPGDPSSIPVNVINSLLDDGNGNIWLATSGASVLCFNKNQQAFTENVTVGRTTYDLCLDNKGVIWAGREGGSILKIYPRTGKYEVQEEYGNFYKNLPHVVVTAVFRDAKNNMWLGSWDKAVYRFNSATNKEETFKPGPQPGMFGNDEATSFAEDAGYHIWIGSKKTGLYIFDPATEQFTNFSHDPSREGSLSHNTINCIYRDRLSNMWVGTNNGISIFKSSQQSFRQHFITGKKSNSPLTIYDFLTDEKGGLLIAASNGLYHEEKNGNVRHIPLSYKNESLRITKIFRDVDGKLYLGTNYTLFRFNLATGLIQPLPNTDKDTVMSKLIESRIVSIVRDTIEGRPVLVTSPYGHFITYYDLEEQRWISRKDTIKNIQKNFNIRDNLVRKMIKSNAGDIWMANFKEGLGRWNATSGGRIEYFVNNPNLLHSISNNNVFDVLSDEQNNLWVSTYGGGLNYFNTGSGRFMHINATNNLSEGIQRDRKGNIWIVSNGNLHRYDIYNKSYTSFDLPDVERTGGVHGYMYRDENDFLYAAGDGYYVKFNPDSVKIEKRVPRVLLTDFKIFNNSYNQLLASDRIVLQYNQNFFSVHFAAPYYEGGGNVQYAYQLEGVEDGWVNAGDGNAASYTNVSGGTYRFKVRATTQPGVWGNDYTVLIIEVIPPVWKRWWFYALCALFISAIIYGIYRYRINEILKRQAIRNKIAQDLHDSVGSTLSSISVYSQVARIQHEKGKNDELKDVLDKIGITSTDMISEMNDIVWAINPRNDSMEKIIQRMESFAKPLLQAKNISFSFEYDPDILLVNLPMEKRKNFYLIFKESVSNVLKYSGCRMLSVSINVEHNMVVLKVQDDGKGFDPEQMKILAAKSLSGNGLNNMKRRASEMKGECLINSSSGGGTSVVLRFPVT